MTAPRTPVSRFGFLSLLCALSMASACGAPETESSVATTAVAPSSMSDTKPALATGDPGRIAARVAALADDAFAGRAPASPDGEKAADWIAAELEAMGAKPAAADGGWFQSVPLVRATLDVGASAFTVAGPDGDVPLSYGADTVYWSKRSGSETVADSPLVFVGYGVVAPEYGWDDYAGLDVAGKTVVMLVNDPGYATKDPALFNGRAMTYYGRWTYKFEEAGRQGAAGAIIIHEAAPASYPWAVVQGSWSGDQFDLDRAGSGADRTSLEGWVSREAAGRLFEAAGLDFAAMKIAAKTQGFTPVPMGDLTASATLVTRTERLPSRNVIATLPGDAAPQEHVLLTAHWDHLGVRDLGPGVDGIHNGAVDNATGVAAVLEVLDMMAKSATPRPRSVTAVFVTAEESGLLGSEYFAIDPVMPLGQIVAGVNIDALHPTGRARNLTVVGYGASELDDLLADAAAARGKTLSPDAHPEAGYYYRSDHISLAKRGVPMLYADSGEDLLEGGEEAGAAAAAEYRDLRYHKPGDEYDAARWNLEGIAEDVGILADVVDTIARSDAWPNWREGAEFRALRDAQRAALQAPATAQDASEDGTPE